MMWKNLDFGYPIPWSMKKECGNWHIKNRSTSYLYPVAHLCPGWHSQAGHRHLPNPDITVTGYHIEIIPPYVVAQQTGHQQRGTGF